MIQTTTTAIDLHLTSGHTRTFNQDNSAFISSICDDLDIQVFTRPSLIVEGTDEALAFPGHALLGISMHTTLLPKSFAEREMKARAVIKEITEAAYQQRRAQRLEKIEGRRSPVISEIVFSTGARIYLEVNEVAAIEIDERSTMHHLFTHPCLFCRRLGGGFSVWNTAHIVSWSHYPKLEVPINSWKAEALPEEERLNGVF